jgi:hypothetical protein
MIETPFPRQGTNPITKEAVAGVSAAANANSITDYSNLRLRGRASA